MFDARRARSGPLSDVWSLGCARAVFTDRRGGVSAGPFASLNLATHVGDDGDAVAENRRRAEARLGCAVALWPRHVHRTDVLTVTEALPAETEVDGCVTADPELAVVAMGADCAPVALGDDAAWGAIHVGWRGLRDGIVAAGVAALRAVGRGPVRAAVGPCICGRCYEFGADDLATVVRAVGPEVASRTATGAPALDLGAGIRSELRRAGVEAVEEVGICTNESAEHYSFRRDGRTGRQAVIVAGPSS